MESATIRGHYAAEVLDMNDHGLSAVGEIRKTEEMLTDGSDQNAIRKRCKRFVTSGWVWAACCQAVRTRRGDDLDELEQLLVSEQSAFPQVLEDCHPGYARSYRAQVYAARAAAAALAADAPKMCEWLERGAAGLLPKGGASIALAPDFSAAGLADEATPDAAERLKQACLVLHRQLQEADQGWVAMALLDLAVDAACPDANGSGPEAG